LVGDLGVEVAGASTRERYDRALAATRRTEGPMVRACRVHEPETLCADMLAQLARPYARAPVPPTRDAARRALAAFLRLTDAEPAWQLADRALVLHMLEGHAPGFFRAAGLGPALAAALARLAELPDDLPPGLDVSEAMWRVDGAYLRAAHGQAHGRLA